MQTELYEKIKEGLQEYIKNLKLPKSQTPTVVGFAPSSPTYPLIVIDEVDNTPYQNMTSFRQTVSSVSYKIDIYAKSVGNQEKQTKQDIARKLMKHCNDYCNSIKLRQVSFNTFPNTGTNGAIYHITLMYSARFFENKQYFV